ALVRRFIESEPDVANDTSKYIEGWGWDHTAWPIQEFPTAADLEADSVVKSRPVVLQSKDGHALWVSQAVLQSMEPLPDRMEGGVVVRDELGRPTGVFLDNAQELVQKPPLTEKDLLRRFKYVVQDALANGLTSIHDAGFSPSEKIINAGNGRLSARSLHEPYADNPGTRGFMRLSADVLNNVIPRFLRDGWQVNVHAIGDRANGIVLDAFEEALKGVNVTALRPRLEHAQILTNADMARIGQLGVIASIQPTHAISDMWFAEDRLGPERVKGLYAFRSIIDNGGRIALGTDFPVEDMNPLAGFHAAITRVTADGRSPHGPGGWFPEQRLTRVEALRGLTIDPAYASFTESTLGSLEPGKRADYVVLSQDIMSVDEKKILDTKVLATAIDGRLAYGKI
ncbi:amidohydrolase 3, partial [Gloeophyllum trabeum ATCC 11539]